MKNIYWAFRGSDEQPSGNPKLVAERVIGISRFKARLCIKLERREISASKLQSIGRPKIVFTVTSEPRAKETATGAPKGSMQGVQITAVKLPWERNENRMDHL
jgi:hypothetical protein